MRAVFLFLLVLSASARAESPRITDVAIHDRGTVTDDSFDASIDTRQSTCGSGGSQAAEPFFSTTLGLTIDNPSYSNLRVSRVRFELTRVGAKRRYRSPYLAVIGPLEVKAGTSGNIYVPMLPIGNGEKIFPGTTTLASSITGLRTIRITVYGKIGSRSISLPALFTASFNDFDRCAGS